MTKRQRANGHDGRSTPHAVVDTVPRNGSLADFKSTFIEGVDFVLLTVIDAFESKGPRGCRTPGTDH